MESYMNETAIKITCHVKLVAKSGKLNELLDTLEICATSSRKEPGCEYHEILQSITNPNEITLIEKYSNYDAFNAHFINPDIREFIDKTQHELLTSMSSSMYITRIDCLGTRGQDEASELSFRKDLIS
jgi:quinol monooxygenase YgiN